MIPVGPLNSKNVGTTVSAWVVTPDALEPFSVPAKEKKQPIAPYLDYPNAKILSISLDVAIDGKMLGKANSNVMDWTMEQLIAHQSSAGCGVRTGDLLGWGTVSGPSLDELGCLLEDHCPDKTARRTYVEDNEEVQMRGYCGKGVGFGECVSKLLPASSSQTWHSQ